MGCCELIALAAFSVCFFSFLYKFFCLVKMGSPKDLSQKSGDVKGAVIYSCIKAMSPSNKESAYLHMPTYAAGILYHIGTFITLPLFVVFMILSVSGMSVPEGFYGISLVISIVLFATSLSGLIILLKRIFSKELKSFSGPDDYISNIITTLAQLATALYIVTSTAGAFYFVVMALFFLWLPIGKTRHLLYFFFARYHLGFFYGWRGTWPQK